MARVGRYLILYLGWSWLLCFIIIITRVISIMLSSPLAIQNILFTVIAYEHVNAILETKTEYQELTEEKNEHLSRRVTH